MSISDVTYLLNGEVSDDEVQLLCKKINKTEIKVNGSKDMGCLNPVLLGEVELQRDDLERTSYDSLLLMKHNIHQQSYVTVFLMKHRRTNDSLIMVTDVESLKQPQLESVSASDSVCIKDIFHADHTLMLPDQMIGCWNDSKNQVCASNKPSDSDCMRMHMSNSPL